MLLPNLFSGRMKREKGKNERRYKGRQDLGQLLRISRPSKWYQQKGKTEKSTLLSERCPSDQRGGKQYHNVWAVASINHRCPWVPLGSGEKKYGKKRTFDFSYSSLPLPQSRNRGLFRRPRVHRSRFEVHFYASETRKIKKGFHHTSYSNDGRKVKCPPFSWSEPAQTVVKKREGIGYITS